MNRAKHLRSLVLLSGALLNGCTGTPIAEEKAARREVTGVGRNFRPEDQKPDLPALRADSTAADYLRFALLNNSKVEAAFYDWRVSVEAITSARSLPDPQLTLQADVVHTVTSFMPGAMLDIMTRGKRAAMGREAAAASEVSYRTYATALVDTAIDLRLAWVELAYVDEVTALRGQESSLADQSLSIAQADYATGQGMGTLEAQTRWLNESAKIQAESASLADQRAAARARFKAALGLHREDADPPWPEHSVPPAPLPDEETLWQQILGANPGLASMQAMVDMSIASVDVAHRAKTPDFSAGLMADFKANPLLFRTWDTMTLPIWRDKIAATIASAEGRRMAAQARLNAEQVSLAAELAKMLFMAREADRMAAYIKGKALPNTERALASAEAAYQSNMGGFASLAELRLMQVDMRLEYAAAQRERETALAELSRLVADGIPAEGLLAEKSLPK
jgi:cobalt-zinc-cadmium efflux system outer membrane protein